MLALSINNYVHAWQLAPMGLFALIWLVGGSYLVRGALAKFPELPKDQRNMNRAFQISFLASGAGLVAMLVLGGLFYAIAARAQFTVAIAERSAGGLIFAALALIVSIASFLAMAWVVLQTMLSLPGKILVGVALRTSGPVLLAALVLGGAAIVPAYFIFRTQTKIGLCQRNIYFIQDALSQYSASHPGHMPVNLQELVDQNYFHKDILECPAHPGRIGYVYVPAATGFPVKDEPAPHIILADRPGNHQNEVLLLMSDNTTDRLSERQFAEKLNDPVNKDFKAAYEKAR